MLSADRPVGSARVCAGETPKCPSVCVRCGGES
ncbi:hypothetical protein VTJ04DRAFT_5988 [Mycothermus thermophilus]